MTTADSGQRLAGTGVTPLKGVGMAWRYDDGVKLPDRADPDDVSPAAEIERFQSARTNVREDLDAERERSRERVGESEADIFRAHKQFLDDPTISEAAHKAIESEMLAEHAVVSAFEESIEQLAAAGGRMAERTDDLRDVRDRLLRELVGAEGNGLNDVPTGAVVVADRLTPSETVALDPDDVAGFVTAEGGRTSHAAIVARSLGIPAVVGVGDAVDEIEDGKRLLVDGNDGEVVRSPDDDVEAACTNDLADVRHESVSTTAGRGIEVAANVGSTQAIESAADRGADGVGLFRTEFFFLERDSPPSEAEQFEAFERALLAFEGRRVVVRTLDVGGDKSIPYLDVEAGSNPFLGLRGIRLAPGERPELFKPQVRALLRAAATEHGDALSVMFPLIASVNELDEVLSTVEAVADNLKDERVESLHNPLSPAVLRAISRAVDAAHEADCWVGMCGEMAGDPDLTPLLVGLGLDELSMSAVTVPEVKSVVDGLHEDAVRALAMDALAASTPEEVAALLDEW